MSHLWLKRFWFIAATLFYALNTATAQTDPNHPNILIIIADDLGPDYLNGYSDNNLQAVTPHIDSLRSAGVTFKQAWASPKCTPSRAAIMSGKYGVHTGVLGTPGELTLDHSSLFSHIADSTNSAYDDALFGKWHLSGNNASLDYPNLHGIDHFDGFWDAMVDDYYNWEKITNGADAGNETEYVTSYITSSAIDWINDRSKPWICWMAHAAPHSPFHIPPSGTYTSANVNSNRQKFRAMIESMDYEIGRLLDNIPSNVKDNTVIFFVGDNGTPSGVIQNHASTHAKSTLYQGGVQVPLIVSGTGVTRVAEEDSAMVHVVDLFSTIMEVAGVSLQGGLHNSLSFKSRLTLSHTHVPRSLTYSELEDGDNSGWTIRNEQYKLIVFDNCNVEFYDILNDPYEENDLYSSPTVAQMEILEELEKEGGFIRESWTCTDGILNGDELEIDCGSSDCPPCDGQLDFTCSETYIQTYQDVNTETYIYAEDSILSHHEMIADDVLFQAGESIVLDTGFTVESGTFIANIAECEQSGITDLDCTNDNSMSFDNVPCCAVPATASSYTESVTNGVRTIVSNNFPNHQYCFNNNIPSPMDYTFSMSSSPTINCEITSILSEEFRPQYIFGIAKNGVLIAPAPATPFIFENSSTGEYNWNWVFEPINNKGDGRNLVHLDCASAHTGPQGYHYHGNMYQYAEEVIDNGLSTTNTPPNEPIQIGWAADGYPILYRFGPDDTGGLRLLKPSYILKSGNRPGDGVSAPCGSYNGKYTNDYRYVEGSGDLDECNGIARSVTLTNTAGVDETFDYFYMITDDFPEIGRCFVGIPDASFD